MMRKNNCKFSFETLEFSLFLFKFYDEEEEFSLSKRGRDSLSIKSDSALNHLLLLEILNILHLFCFEVFRVVHPSSSKVLSCLLLLRLD